MELHIVVPTKQLRSEFGWLYDKWGEHAVKTYVVKHPEIKSMIDKDAHIVGVGELEFSPQKPGGPHSLDILLCKGKTYYAVEVKNRGSQLQFAWNQLHAEVLCFQEDMKKHGQPYDKIVPVLVSVSDDVSRPEKHVME